MRQEERQGWKAIRLSVEKERLDLEKAACLLNDLQNMLQKKEENHPELYQILELHRAWVQVRNLKMQIRQMREILDCIREGVRNLEKERFFNNIREPVRGEAVAEEPVHWG